MKNNDEFPKFDAAMRKVVTVSHEELKRREEEWKKEHPKTRSGRRLKKVKK